MKFRPLHDRVVVRRIEADTKTAGGIIIPDTAKEKPQKGTVVAIESVREQWITKVARARSLLESRFLNELPPILSGLDAHGIREKLNAALLETYEILNGE